MWHNKPHKKVGEKVKHEKLRKFRMTTGMTQTEFAKKIGIDRSYYSQIENGSTEPSLKLLGKIAESLGKNLKDFF